jgi:hypothetical protein
MDDADSKPPRGRSLTVDERERAGRREGLELSRLRVKRELEEATSPLRRTSLEHALRYLDEELSKLDR